MKMTRPRKLLGTFLKKAKRGFSKKEPSGREAAGKEATKQDETLKQEPPRTKTPRTETPTTGDGNVTPVAGSDALTLGMMLLQEHNALENRQDSNLQRKPMEDANIEEAAELPPKIVVSPASDQDMGREGSHHESFTKSDANDYRLDLGEKDVDLGSEKLKCEEIKRKTLSFKGATFDGTIFDRASFKGACFDGAHFNGGSFNQASFDGASFAGASFNSGLFQGASFNTASFKGASFGRAAPAEGDDRHSIATEDLNQIYGDGKDEDVVLKASKTPVQPPVRDADTPADTVISSKDLKNNEALFTGHIEAQRTVVEDHSHVNGFLRDVGGVGKDREEPTRPQTPEKRSHESTSGLVESTSSKSTNTSYSSCDADPSTSISDHSDLDRAFKDPDAEQQPVKSTVQEDYSIKTTMNGVSPSISDGETALDINCEALKHIATYFLPGAHGACVSISEKDEGGTFHDIRVLTFEDGWTCIGRFTREDEPLCKTESELATVAYVREHTDIPVPETYFSNYNRNHVVGCAFVLMERLEGVTLDEIWDDLPLEHKISAVEEIAHVIGQLADLRFDRIGSLTWDGRVGPLVNLAREAGDMPESPFMSFDDFVDGALDQNRRSRYKGAMVYYRDIKKELHMLLDREPSNTILQAPFRLVHDDFEFWNMLVTRESECHPPKISGIIDWDWAFIGPLYYLYEYPPDLTDLQKDPDTFATNKMLRKTFVKAIAQRFSKSSNDREQVKKCFREKSDALNSFLRIFAGYNADDDETEEMFARTYLRGLRDEDPDDNHHPYGIIEGEWVPDSDFDCDD